MTQKSDMPETGTDKGKRKTKKLSFSRDWVTRPVFGVLLASGALAFIFAGKAYVALLAVVTTALAAREWHKIVDGGRLSRGAFLTVGAIIVALADYVFYGRIAMAAIVLGVCAVIIYIVKSGQGRNPLWHAAGTLYLGIPALSVVAIRGEPHGVWLILGLFLTVWATDSGALIFGNLCHGPKLAPKISPNKTWSGFFGGIFAAALVNVVFAWALHLSFWGCAVLGAALAVTAHLGDLFESVFKRRFRVKDSSDLIPGHGGALDRIDSTLAAAVALAIVIFVFRIDISSLLGVRS